MLGIPAQPTFSPTYALICIYFYIPYHLNLSVAATRNLEWFNLVGRKSAVPSDVNTLRADAM